MDFIALVVAVVAIVATIISATSSSVRNEAHHQVTLIQELLKEISEATHNFFVDMAASPTIENEASKGVFLKKALVYELSCSVKCDLLESSLQLLVRRCSRVCFFDAEVEKFRSDGIALLGNLRDVLSDCAYSKVGNTTAMHKVDANLVRLHVLLNEYIGERFRPIFEHTSR
jgi:hypothetical protein